MHRLSFSLLACLGALSGCLPDTRQNQPTYYPQPARYAPPSLNDVQQKALADGCELRHSGNAHKLHECLNQEGNWRDALAQGCQARYNQVPKKMRECMDY